jgi:hypothetical protein
MKTKRVKPTPTAAPQGAVQIAIRLDHAVVGQLDELAVKLSRPGLSVTRTDALRVALLAGLETVMKERVRV